MAKSKSSIRINQLARELGVTSKDILEKLKAEEMETQAPNHQSAVSLGLAETIREWFSGQGASTAVEIAPPVAKAKPSHPRKKKVDAEEAEHSSLPIDGEDEAENEAIAAPSMPPEEQAPTPVVEAVVVPHAEHAQSPQTIETVSPADAPVEAVVPASLVVEAPTLPATLSIDAPSSEVEEFIAPAAADHTADHTAHTADHTDHTDHTAAPIEAAPVRPAAESPAEAVPSAERHVMPPAPAHPAHPAKPIVKHGPRTPSPTVRIAPTSTTAPARRAKFVPEPAKIMGPRVVRVEKEETVNIGPNRSRGPRMPDSDGPTVTPAVPRGGRGVKVTEEEETAEKEKEKKKGRSLSSRRRGADGRRGEALEKLKEYTDADLLERQERLAAATGYRTSVDSHMKRQDRTEQHQQAKSIVQKGEPVEIEEPITVRSLSAALGLKTNDIIGKLMRQGVFATLNQSLDIEAASKIALEWGLELKIRQEPTLEELLMTEFRSRIFDPNDLVSRPAVVTILGHVDHGKTSLLDKIRNANVAAGEAGGITQHTAAWMVEMQAEAGVKRVTFIDTPGHQAFTAMRARGANMTDVVVLVVSAVEGVQPQTVESINHAKAAGVVIVVAMNKVDRPDAGPDMVLGQLAKEGLNPVEWGGDTEVIRTSATTGEGIKDLIEMLDYQSALLQLKTDPTAPAQGTVIESQMAAGLGPVATVLVQDGTVRPGDVLLCGRTYGKVRRMLNDRGEALTVATAGMPVVISGLSGLPNAGDKVFQLNDLDRAKNICEDRQTEQREKHLGSKTAVSLDNLLDTIKQEDMKEVRLVIKADVAGSVETLEKAVVETSSSEVRVRVIHAAAGPINESDVELADASKAVIIGFNVAPDESARAMAEQRRIEVRQYRVIYEILDDLKKALSGMLEPEIREKYHGRSEVRQIFKVSRLGNIAGCMVIDGHIQRGSKIRLIRDGRIVVEEMMLESLRRGKEDAKEVKQGFECGMKLAGYDDIKIGDIFEAYIRETIQRTL